MQEQQAFPNLKYVPLCKTARCNIHKDNNNKRQNNAKIALFYRNFPSDHSEKINDHLS